MNAVDFVRALSRVMQDKPVHENSNQSGDMTTAASQFLAYGDFQQFVIVDRVGVHALGPGDPERGAGHSEELTGESNLIVVVVKCNLTARLRQLGRLGPHQPFRRRNDPDSP